MRTAISSLKKAARSANVSVPTAFHIISLTSTVSQLIVEILQPLLKTGGLDSTNRM
jgi:hypothetical protein